MLTYDQIPTERRTIGDFTSRLGDDGHNGALAVMLAQWMARDDTRAEPRSPVPGTPRWPRSTR